MIANTIWLKTKMPIPNERDLDDYSIVSVECESVSTTQFKNNGNGSENNTSKHNSEKADSDGFIEINDYVDKCLDDETALLSNEGNVHLFHQVKIRASFIYNCSLTITANYLADVGELNSVQHYQHYNHAFVKLALILHDQYFTILLLNQLRLLKFMLVLYVKFQSVFNPSKSF